MRIGIMSGGSRAETTLEGVIARAKDIEARGFHALWMANIFGHDAINTLALIGRETQRMELGTAVVPSYPRHPVAIAQQALTTQAASGGRFTLGIGLSHKMVIENMFGFSYEKPALHMKEYLQVLAPLLAGEPVEFAGDQYRVNATLSVPDAEPVPLLLAALGDRMLELAGRHTAGTILWMTGPKTIESHIVPRLRKATAAAGRPEPRVVAGLPIALTGDTDAARAYIAKNLAMYGTLPSYRAMLDKEGVQGPDGVAILGDEAALDAGIQRLRDIGVTDFDAFVVSVEKGCEKRTLDYLQSRLT